MEPSKLRIHCLALYYPMEQIFKSSNYLLKGMK